MFNINFDYIKAIAQATAIEKIADDMLSISNKGIETTVDDISVIWQGEAANLFNETCIEMQEDIRQQANKLKDLASRIRKVAKILKDAEEEAKQKLEQTSV